MTADPRDLADEQARLVTISLIIIASVATAFALWFTRPVMVPLVLAFFAYYLVSPAADYLETRLRFPRWVSTIVMLLVVAGGIALLGLLLLTSARGLDVTSGIYRERILKWGTQIAGFLDARGFDLSQEVLVDGMGQLPFNRLLQTSAIHALTLVTNGILVLIFVVFLLLGRRREMFKSDVFRQIDAEIRRYLTLKIMISAATGLLVWIILQAFGLQLALVFGVLAFVLNFIPSVGSIIATFLPLPVALVQFETMGPVWGILLLTALVQFSVGSVLDPKLMGDRLNLSPVTILAALVFWGLLWGIAGMLLAAPLTASLRIVLAQFRTTRAVSDLLAGRVALAGQTAEWQARHTPAAGAPAHPAE